MDTADLRVVSSKQYCGEHPPLKIPYGTSSRVSCYVGKNSLLLLYSSGSPRPSSFNYGNECASFPQTLRYEQGCSAAWKSTIRKYFLIQTPCLMCIAVGTTVEESDVCHLNKREVFGHHHESNKSNQFNCSQLSTSSDCFYVAVVCSRDTAYASTHWAHVIVYSSVG